jgi:hypothetical protein
VRPADLQDRAGAVPLLKASRLRHSFVVKAFADSAYNSDRVANATSIDVQIVRRIAHQSGFVVHPLRWVVSEPSLGWAATAGLLRTSGRRSPHRTRPSNERHLYPKTMRSRTLHNRS